mgnify:CR=1 FL=1
MRSFVMFLALIGCCAAGARDTSLTHVLFVGNSYLFYNDGLHNHAKRMATERFSSMRSGEFQYKSATIGGARLQHHNIDWLLKPGRIGVERPFQVVIMQGGSFEPLTDEARESFIETTVAYSHKVRQYGGRPMLYMTPAYVPPHAKADEGMIDQIMEVYLKAGEAAGAAVIPVGLAFEKSYKERPNFSLHMSFDGTHPNLRGTFLGAYVVLLSLYGDVGDSLNYDYFGRLNADEVSYLQRIARAVVADFRVREM